MSTSQEIKPKLSAPDHWRSESYEFPLPFAPEIDLVGAQEVLFAQGWSDTESDEFWTYHITWFIDHKNLTEKRMSNYFNLYYDGLIKVILNNQPEGTEVIEPDETLSLFIKTNEGFTGKVRTFDPFFTKEYLTLFIQVEEIVCKISNQQIVTIDISPKSFDHSLWNDFDSIKVINGCNE